jgi:peptidyl-prolyl cis-trans isomerase SurA
VKYFIFFILLSLSFTIAQTSSGSEKLLDKIIAVINSKVISLSEINRMNETLEARKEISPIIYTEKNYNQKQLLEISIRSYIIRDKINTQGYVINDDAVESRIKMTEERLGLKRSDLLQFLRGKGLTYEEYFEIIRETMEFNIFAQRIIAPLITITEQEIKNEYYRRNSLNNALSFKYSLVDFFISSDKLLNQDHAKFLDVLKDYQLTGKLPEEFKSLETNSLENLNEDGLSKNLAMLLKSTSEGSFSSPISIGNNLHIFYVQKKDLVESQDFLKFKDQIQNDLFTNKGKSVTTNWFDREYSNYYIKTLL